MIFLELSTVFKVVTNRDKRMRKIYACFTRLSFFFKKISQLIWKTIVLNEIMETGLQSAIAFHISFPKT